MDSNPKHELTYKKKIIAIEFCAGRGEILLLGGNYEFSSLIRTKFLKFLKNTLLETK